MACITSYTFAPVHFAETAVRAMLAAEEAANAVRIDDGLPDRKFVYLKIQSVRITRVEGGATAAGWEIGRRRVQRPKGTCWALTLYREFGVGDRQTKAMEAAVQVFREEGYDSFIGIRYDWI